MAANEGIIEPTFSGFLKATGQTKMWNVAEMDEKLGWNTSTNESSYSQGTLIGNWNEDKFDVKEMVKPTPLQSQCGHYFETTYSTSYNHRTPTTNPVRDMVNTNTISKAFPGHQPELDTPEQKQSYKTLETCSQLAYKIHKPY